MKRFQRLPVLLVSFLLLASCAGGPAGEGVVTVTFWHSFVANTQPALNELLRRFHEEHPGIRVDAQYIPTGDALIQKLVSSVQSGTAPDISWVHADFLGPLVQADALYPMAHFIDGPDGLSREELDDIFPALLQAAHWQDTLYALPMEATLLALFYNKNHFRAAGLDPARPPQTWAELRDYTRRLTRDADGDGKIEQVGFYVPIYPASGPLSVWVNLQFVPYLWQAGGVELAPDQRQVRYNSDAGVEALSLWRDLFRDAGSVTTTMTHDMSFATGYASMIMDGPWDLPHFREIDQFEWGIAPLPRGPAAQATYLAGEHMAIFKQSAHPEEAWTFVRWVLRPETQAFFSAASGYLPVRRATLALPAYREALAADPGLRAFVDQMPLGRARANVDFYHVEINQHLAEAIERTLVGGVDPRQALDEAARRSNTLLERASGRSRTAAIR